MKKYNLLLVLIILFSSIAGASKKSPVALVRNPFDHPDLNGLPKSELKSFAETASEKLKLLATLVANKNSIANINGILLKSGDTIEGYLLLLIKENTVLLKKNGKKVVLYMKDIYSQNNKLRIK